MLQGSRTAKWLFKESVNRASKVLSGNLTPSRAMAENPKMLFDFSRPEDLRVWSVRSDRMWGGKSLAVFDRSKSNPQIAVFKGRLNSWVPNGMQRSGYSAIRTSKLWWNLEEYDHFSLKLKSDGTRFLFNVKADVIHDYELQQVAVAVPPNKWVEVVIPYSIFMQTFMGRPPQIPTWGITAKSIEDISILVDKRDGPFSIELEYIKAFRQDTPDAKIRSRRSRQSFCYPVTEPPEEFPPEAFDEESDMQKIEQMEEEERERDKKGGIFGRIFSSFMGDSAVPNSASESASSTSTPESVEMSSGTVTNADPSQQSPEESAEKSTSETGTAKK